MHRTLEISEADATQYISNSSGISTEILACSRFQKTGPVRSRYPNRANKTIAKSASPIKNFWLRHWLLMYKVTMLLRKLFHYGYNINYVTKLLHYSSNYTPYDSC